MLAFVPEIPVTASGAQPLLLMLFFNSTLFLSNFILVTFILVIRENSVS